MMGTVEWCRSIPRLLFLMLTITQPQFITTMYAAKTRMASARMKWMGVMVISPNAEVSDGGGPQAPEFVSRCRPPPFAPPKS